MLIYCYGASNTYGYDPRSYLGSRYPKEQRWTGILSRTLGHEFRNEGMNGRKIPRRSIEYPNIPPETDIFAVMLGTNEILQGVSAAKAAEHLEKFLSELDFPKDKMLIIAPPILQKGDWVTQLSMAAQSAKLGAEFAEVARRLGAHFADGTQWDIPVTFDGVHFSAEGHAAFAEALGKFFTNGEFDCII